MKKSLLALALALAPTLTACGKRTTPPEWRFQRTR